MPQKLRPTLEEIAEFNAMQKEKEKKRKSDQERKERERLRDEFAMAALRGSLSNPCHPMIGEMEEYELCAYLCYGMADAMLDVKKATEGSAEIDAMLKARKGEKSDVEP
jgi:hypothetical protein